MTTFSQLVDEIAAEMVRPDMRTRGDIQEYTNQVIRELHTKRQTNGNSMAILFESNRLEDEVEIAELPAIWEIPAVARFQRFETAYYVERGCYARKKHPDRNLLSGIGNSDPYWYRSGSGIVFNGINEGETIKLSWFEFPRRLAYYMQQSDPTPIPNPAPSMALAAPRPATWDYETEAFAYATAYDVNATTRENARNLTTNWVLQRWSTVVKEGVRAKIFKRQGEESRAKMTFSLYESLREGMHSSEAFEEGVMT